MLVTARPSATGKPWQTALSARGGCTPAQAGRPSSLTPAPKLCGGGRSRFLPPVRSLVRALLCGCPQSDQAASATSP
jgi:hypothetical protein